MLIKSTSYSKLGKDSAKVKLPRDPTLGKSDPNEFKMALFDNVEQEEIFLFIWNFQMTLEASYIIVYSAKIQYLFTLLHGEALHRLNTFSVEVESTAIAHKTSFLGVSVMLNTLIRLVS